MSDYAAAIAKLNDEFRSTFRTNLGKVVFTQGFNTLPDVKKIAFLRAIKSYDNFNVDNDPYGEHDYGMVHIEGRNVIWKIDYYDKSMKYVSPDPADPHKTRRVLTIMLGEEY